MKRKKYYKELDVIKGVAILLVIMGHSDSAVEIPNCLDPFIRSYSMALFFVASGFLFSFKDTWCTFFQKKAMRLIIPYISFGLLTIAKRYFLSDYTVSGSIDLKNAFMGLLYGEFYWYLYLLFFFMVVCRIINNSIVLSLLAIISFLLPFVFQTDSFIFTRIIQYPFYFICGIFLRNNYNKLRFIILKNAKVLGILLLFLYIIIMTSSANILYLPENQFIRKIVGVVFIWVLSVILVENTDNIYGILKPLKHLGKYSLQYYLNHLLLGTMLSTIVLKAHISYGLVNWIFIIALTIFLSWLMLLIEKKNKFTRIMSGI